MYIYEYLYAYMDLVVVCVVYYDAILKNHTPHILKNGPHKKTNDDFYVFYFILFFCFRIFLVVVAVVIVGVCRGWFSKKMRTQRGMAHNAQTVTAKR